MESINQPADATKKVRGKFKYTVMSYTIFMQ